MKELVRGLQKLSAPSMACTIQNFYQSVRGRKVSFGYDKTSELFWALDNDRRQYFSQMKMGFSKYERGLQHRARQIADSYLLQHVKLEADDVVVDCGANYADLFLFLESKLSDDNYIAFEPGPEEYACIERNAPKSRTFKMALSDVAEDKTFFISSAGADSSLIEPKTYTDTVTVTATTLDLMREQLNLENVKLLKLEAEGFEPEILRGAEQFLPICEFVAIDGGNERGANEEETFSAQTNFLFKHGFELVEVNLKWGRALFRRTTTSS